MIDPKKQAFLENYPKFCQVRATCQAIGIGKTTFYRWLEEDELFRDEWDALKKEIDAHRLELYEAELDKRALGQSKQSDILLMFALKALNPGKYRDKAPETKLVGDVTIKLAVPDYDERLRLIPGNVIEGEVKELPRDNDSSAS